MKHIKSYLIHLLGGVTKQELAREKAPTYLFWHFCMLNRINSIKQKADSLSMAHLPKSGIARCTSI